MVRVAFAGIFAASLEPRVRAHLRIPCDVVVGLVALDSVKELMTDRGRPHADLYEVARWADMLRVQGDEVVYACMVDNQAIVIPETIDAIRALRGTVDDPDVSIRRTNTALGIEPALI
jgi:glyceraldehyde-3-phosphate dehydrogenase (NAD(P))